MAILNRFLKLLELLEHASDVAEFLATPTGIALSMAVFSYQALLIAGCDGPTAGILAFTIALTLECGLSHPDS